MIKSYIAVTSNKKLRMKDLPFLSYKQKKEFESVEYTGKTTKGLEMSSSDYLNSLGIGQFVVIVTTSAKTNGPYNEEFVIDHYT